jgi:hypothetical protein
MPRRGDKMKKFFLKVWKFVLFLAEITVATLALSGVEFAGNFLKMVWQLIKSLFTSIRAENLTVQNLFRYENLVRTDFVSMLVQGLILVLLAKLAYKLLKKYFKRKWSVE